MVYKLKDNRVLRAYYGGKRIDKFLGKTECKDSRYPEEWVASVTRAKNNGVFNGNEGMSYCEDGRLLADIISAAPAANLGRKSYERFGGELSVLVKILDANERLFIQCHPTVEMAKKYFNSQFGKTECWIILEAEENACVYLGFKEGISEEKWRSLFEAQDISGMLECMHRISVKRGDIVFVDGGMPHAIGGGCMMIEAQEPTDLMVVPERRSKSGIVLADERMHCGLGFDKMFECFNYKGYSYDELCAAYVKHFEPINNEITNAVGKDLTDKFTVDFLKFDRKTELKLYDCFRVAIVLEGKGVIENSEQKVEIKKGDMMFISADTPDLSVTGCGELVLCY